MEDCFDILACTRQVGRLLPKISGAELYTEPSLTQLAAMAREDEASLGSVANFKVCIPGTHVLLPAGSYSLDFAGHLSCSATASELTFD